MQNDSRMMRARYAKRFAYDESTVCKDISKTADNFRESIFLPIERGDYIRSLEEKKK
jgi:hypothetical protein